ncbi:MAG TPA: 23S rRNA (pseudouridine(1915)-N(3))-methyltransferase RlmH [Longimicrobiales bacterium]
MRLSVLCVGRPGRLLADAVAEYERRARRYWTLDVVEIRAEPARRGRPDAEIRARESRRLLERVPEGADVVALTRSGERWSSEQFSRYLEGLAVASQPGAAFLIGGALGLDSPTLAHARVRLSLSPFTLAHDIARLVLMEQLYRAGTIVRGEPYHKGRG